MHEDEGENNQIEHLEKEEKDLYSTTKPAPVLKHHNIHGTSFKVRSSWKESPLSKSGKARNPASVAKKFFLFSLLILIVAFCYAGYKLFFSESRESFVDRHIELKISTAAFTRGGEELPVALSVTNTNGVALTNTHILIEYPRGSIAETPDDFEKVQLDLGDVAPGATVSRSVPVILYGREGSSKDLAVSFEYTLPDSALTYTKHSTASVSVSSSPIILEVDAPKTTSTNQVFSGSLRVIQNTKVLPKDALVTILFPRDFTLESISPKPSFGTSTWALNTEKDGDFFDIKYSGRFSSQEGEERTISFTSGVPSPDDITLIKTGYVSESHTVDITKPFLDTFLFIGNEHAKTIAVAPDSYIQGQIAWRNRDSFPVVNPQFHLHLEGPALDKTSILPVEGFYDSGKNEIFWDKDTMPTLGTIAPNQSGTLNFTLRVLPKTAEGPSIVRDPQVKFSLSISGMRDDGSSSPQYLADIESASARVTTETSIDASVISASGAVPPQVEHETIYQITLSLKNTHNDITAGRTTMKLPFYVKWVGKVSVNEKMAYNPDTREVVWTLGNIASGAGNTTGARNGVFQVSISPSLSQVDSSPELVQNILFTGTDLFSGKDVKAIHTNINTRIQNGTSRDAIVIP